MNFEIQNESGNENADTLVVEALRKSSKILSKNKALEVEIEKIEDDFVRDNMNGVMGMPRGESNIEMQFDPRNEDWKTHLPVMTAHEYAHTFYAEKWGHRFIDYKWRHILQEAHSQNFAEKIYPDIEAPMRKHLSKSEVSKYWSEIRNNWLEKESVGRGDPLFHGTGKFPNWIGYSLAYYIGKQLMKDYNLERFPELEKEDIIDAGNQIFNKD